MKKRYHIPLIVVGVLGIAVAFTALFSRAQQFPQFDDLAAITKRGQERRNAWFNKRVPHPASALLQGR